MKKQSRILLFAAVFGLLCPVCARGDLTSTINRILARRSQKKVHFGIHIVNVGSGKTIYARNARKPMIPASNIKLITTAAALNYLGPDYKYRTLVGLASQSLTVIGSGDPLLGDGPTDAKYGRGPNRVFDEIIAALKKEDIRHIKDIVIDTGIFDDNRVHPSWPKSELNRPYACEISGLNYNGNCVKIIAGNNGNDVTVTVKPQTSYVSIVNKVVPASKGTSAVGSYRNTQPNKITVHGKCRKQAAFDIAIERPAAFFAHLLAENLSKNGITAKGDFVERRVTDADKFRLLKSYRTPITDVLTRCNKDSFGLAAEALLKTIAAEGNRQKRNGNWQQGREKISQYLLGLGIGREEFFIDDGSGLSTKNRLSANAVTKVLLDMYRRRNWRIFKESLAVGGADGTAAKYFKEKKYKGKIFAKTGYIKGVKALSGVCSTNNGDFLFAILANKAGGKTRTAINDIVKALVDESDTD